jgi:hypothetical protein
MKFLRRFPYWYLLVIPVLLFGLGIASNQAVLVANHGKFPVAMNAAWMDKMCTLPEDVDPADVPASSCANGGEMIDMTHSVMGPNSHLKMLSDIFPLGHAIYSVGDGLLSLGDWLLSFTPIMWLALTIRKLYVVQD